MADSSAKPHVMCVEFGHIGFDQVRSVMEEMGYIYDIHSYANAYFIRADMVQMFAFRAAAESNSVSNEEHQRVLKETDRLGMREAELLGHVKSLENSRALKAARILRKLVPRFQ